ncbi:MAG: hypothetical protein Q7U59_10870 [Lutibacter sp.]|nr:hypothetical protein [Lutibacter sp.]
MANYLRNFKNNCVKNGYLGVTRQLAGRAFRFNLFYFAFQLIKKVFPLQSLTQLAIKMINPKSTFNNLTASIAKEYAKIAKHFK